MRVLGGRYRLLDRLDQGGGRAVVWRGYDQVLDRPVAVRLLAGDFTDAAGRELARVEARTAAQLSHPHICEVYDYAELTTESGDHAAYLVTELLAGPTLEDRLQSGPVPVPAALRVCAQVASALAAAHACGLVHRRIAPARVVLGQAGAKLVDFGVPAAAGAPGQPAPDEEMGSAHAWLAPERLLHGKPRPASDVYALGLLVYRTVSGAAPWPAETVTQILETHQYREPAPLPPVEGLPDTVAELCRRCLATDPQERPTAHDAARRLAEAGGWQVSRVGYELIEADEDPPMPAPEPATVAAQPVPPPAAPAEPAGAPAPAAEEAAAAAGRSPGPPPLPPASGAEADGPAPRGYVKRHHLRQHRPRRWPILLAAAAVAAVLAGVTGTIWLASNSTERHGSGAPAPGAPSASPLATHPPGAGAASSRPGASPAGPTDPTRPGAGEPRHTPGDPGTGEAGAGHYPSTSPDLALPEPAPETPTTVPPGSAYDLVETPAGTIVARCVESAASVEPLDLAPGYRVIAHTRGPGVVRAGIVLGSSGNEVRVDVRCRAGEPVSAVDVA